MPNADTKVKSSSRSINIDAANHVTGRTRYIDDVPVLSGTYYAKVFYSKVAHGKIVAIDTSIARAMSGVIRILSYKDIPGLNEIGGIIQDEPLLAVDEVHFIGMPILIVIAKSELIAHKACEAIKIDVEIKSIVVDPIEAFEAGQLLSGRKCFKMGDTKRAFNSCIHIFEGTAETGGQEHIYLEPQGAYAIPNGDGSMKILSSTQGPTAVQRTVANVLGCSMNKIEVDVNRIGGGFGGKEDQASPWAAIVAVGAHLTGHPVKYILERDEDLQMTGKRHPYKSNYKIGLNKDYKIQAYEATFYQNGGAANDLSPAVLERTLYHATNSYYIPNVNVEAYSCKTNLPPNTAFRGFGGPQGMFVMETAIHHAARGLEVPSKDIQDANLVFDGSIFSYGQTISDTEMRQCWDQTLEAYEYKRLSQEVEDYNLHHNNYKKGIYLMPICFGISFTNTMMNNARALVHVYSDGSIGVSTGAIEMGQGVSSKMVQIAMRSFGVYQGRVKLETTNTTRVANTSPSAASATADLNGKALQDACGQIIKRLKQLLSDHWSVSDSSLIVLDGENAFVPDTEYVINWEQLINLAFVNRVNLSAKGHYATPEIHFDRKTAKGSPFAYYVNGAAIVTCTVDCLRGNYEFDSVKIVHDFGSSMNPAVDLGQIEGGLVQGIGWMTLEELIYNEKGELKSSNLANYKIPDIYSAPKKIEVAYLDGAGDDLALLKSKAVGEPPLMYGIGAYFAICNAILAFNPLANITYAAPMTTEKVLLSLYS